MTPKQIERIKIKITKIKKELAADKKRWGGFYDDSRGLRYLPPELYLKIRDYPGALRYFNWFHKNFPEDAGFPLFLFEWAITLFKLGKLKNAEDKILETYSSNAYIIHSFLEIKNNHLFISENSNWQTFFLAQNLPYSKNDPKFLDFADWLSEFINEERFAEGVV